MAPQSFLNLHSCLYTIITTLATYYYKSQHLSFLLQVLDLTSSRSLSALPDSIESLNQLIGLMLSGCSELETIPAGISELVLLELLDLSNCNRLTALPEVVLAALRQLKVLNLSGCTLLANLPDSIGSLSQLKVRVYLRAVCVEIECLGQIDGLRRTSCSLFG